MTLAAQKIGLFSPDNRKVKTLLLELFPERERLDMALLRFRSLSGMVDYFGYYDEANRFCGFAYVIHTDKMAFILYLAVDGAMHSKGYGGEIMRQVLQRHEGKEIVLNCEPLDDHAENAEQRSRRIRFYERLGLKVTDYQYVVGGDFPFAIMSSRSPFSVEEYLGSQDPAVVNPVEEKAMIIGLARIIRREIRRDGMNREDGRRLIEACRTRLADLLPRVDTLTF